MTDESQPEAAVETASTAVRAMLGGALMGLANLVPGISGGTMLLAAGVYPDFINGIAEVTTFRWRLRTFIVLACIIGAAAVAFVGLAGPVSQLVIEHRWIMYSLFIGLTLGGAPILWNSIRRLDAPTTVMIVLGIGVMALLALTDPVSSGAAAGDGRPYAMYVLAGLAGASAMVLPGISGGYLLLVLGQYVTVLTAVSTMKDGLTARDWDLVVEALHVVIPVGIGVVIGIVGVSNLIRLLLAKFERPTLGLLLGLLLGAVIGLWPFQEGVAPEVGSGFKGDTVVMIDGNVALEASGKVVEPGDYPTAFFTPTVLQIAASLGIIGVGLAISLLVAHIGNGGSATRETDEGSSDEPQG